MKMHNRAWLRGHCLEAAWLAVLLRSFAASGEVNNPAAPAVKREAEEDWGR
jgi:hypothetical protein